MQSDYKPCPVSKTIVPIYHSIKSPSVIHKCMYCISKDKRVDVECKIGKDKKKDVKLLTELFFLPL